MVYKLAQSIGDYLSLQAGISEDDRDVVVYRLFHLFSGAIHIVLLLAVSLSFGTVPQITAFTLFFGSIKRYAGGLHSEKHWQCLISYTLLAFICSQAGKLLSNFPGTKWLALVITLATSVIIFAAAPVPHYNRPVTSKQFRKFKHISRMVSVIHVAVTVLVISLGFTGIILCGALGGLSAALMLLPEEKGGKESEEAG